MSEFALHNEQRNKDGDQIDAADLIQDALLPKFKDFPGLRISACYEAASQIGGDWYGHHYDPHTHSMHFFIGDITGHGVAAALLTGLAYGAVYAVEKHAFLGTIEDRRDQSQRLLDLARILNEVFYDTAQQRRFMTMAFLSVNLESGICYYVNAGHPPFFILKEAGAERSSKVMTSLGSPLGCDSIPKLKVKTIQLEPGDIVFLYTDGLIENSSALGERFEYKDLKRILRQPIPFQELIATVKDSAAKTWAKASQRDDVTILAFSWLRAIKRGEIPHQTSLSGTGR